MRRNRLKRWLALLVAVGMMLWLVSPTWAESGCHKVKGGGGGNGGSTNVIQVH